MTVTYNKEEKRFNIVADFYTINALNCLFLPIVKEKYEKDILPKSREKYEKGILPMGNDSHFYLQDKAEYNTLVELKEKIAQAIDKSLE